MSPFQFFHANLCAFSGFCCTLALVPVWLLWKWGEIKDSKVKIFKHFSLWVFGKMTFTNWVFANVERLDFFFVLKKGVYFFQFSWRSERAGGIVVFEVLHQGKVLICVNDLAGYSHKTASLSG